MEKLFKRALCFALGMVFGITVLLGGIVGGAYWAYKNVKPIDAVNSGDKVQGLGELESASIEELLNLIADAVENPDEYKVSRLEKEYGLDVKSLLSSVGVDTTNTAEVDLNAISDIPLFSLATNGGAFLDGIKFRALYVVLPKLLGKPMDEILSAEAQARLGDYSILDLIEKDEITGELGVVSALKKLKLGALLPTIFNAKYDRETHEYIYTVNEKSASLNALNLVANSYVGAILNLANGYDVIAELQNGGLRSVGEHTLHSVFTMIAGEGSALAHMSKAFGETRLRDLFVKDGEKYVLSLSAVTNNLKVGYLLGYYLGVDGYWYQDANLQSKVTGVNDALANVNVNDVLENKNDIVGLVNTAFGEVAIGDLLNFVRLGGALPKSLEGLNTVTVSELLGDGTNVAENVRLVLSNVLEDITLGALLNLRADNAILERVYQIKVGALIKPNVTATDVLRIVQEALNGVAVGDLLGYTRDGSGKWNCTDSYLSLFLDLTFAEAPGGVSLLVFLSVIAQGGITDICKSVFGDVTLGNVYQTAFKLQFDQSTKNYYKSKTDLSGNENRIYLDQDFADVLQIKLWQLGASIDPNHNFVLYENVKELSVGEFLYSLFVSLDKLPSGMMKVAKNDFAFIESEEDGYAMENSDVRQLSELLFQIDVEEIHNNKDDKEYWVEKLKAVKTKSIVGMFLTDSAENNNAFTKGLLGVTVGEMIDVLNTSASVSNRKALSDLVTNNFEQVEINGEVVTVTFGDMFKTIIADYQTNCTLKTLGALPFAKSVNALLGYESKTEVFGDVTLSDLVGGYLAPKMANSDFIKATLGVNLKTISNYTKNRTFEYLLHSVLEPQYENLTLYDCIDDFVAVKSKLDGFEEVLNIQLTTVIHAIHTKQFADFKDEFLSAFKRLGKQEQLVVFAGASGLIGALYVFDNELLVKLMHSALGADTWGKYLANRLGYENVDGEYLLGGTVKNPMLSKLLNQPVYVTLDRTKVNIKNEYLKQITLGEMMAIKPFEKALTLFDGLGINGFASTESGQIYIDGAFDRISKQILQIKLYDLYSNRTDLGVYLKSVLEKTLVGDLVAGVAVRALKAFDLYQRYAFDENDNFVVSGAYSAISQKLYNLSLSTAIQQKQAVLKDIIKSSSVGDLLCDGANMASAKYFGTLYNGSATLLADGTYFATGDYDEILNILYNVNVDMALSGLKANGKSYLGSEQMFGTLKLGYAFANGNNYFDQSLNAWCNPLGEPIVFEGADGVIRKTIYNLTVGDLLGGEFKFDKLLNGVYLGELMGYTCQNQAVGHEHGETCVWGKKMACYDQNDLGVGEQELCVELSGVDKTMAELLLSDVIGGGFSLSTVFSDNYLGDVIGMQKVFVSDDIVWYSTQKHNSLPLVSGENGWYKKVLSETPASAIYQTLCSIYASELIQPTAINTIIGKVKNLSLGEVLEYDKQQEGGVTVWYKNGIRVDGLMAKLATYTVVEIETDLDDIINSWTITDVLGETAISDNSLLKNIANVPLIDLSAQINAMEVGVLLGFEKRVDGKWYSVQTSTVVTDEMALVLADYTISQLTGDAPTSSGKPFTEDVIDKMLNGVTLKTIYPNAGQADANGFMAVLDGDWKLCELSTKLMEKLKTDTSIDQLIDLGVFGDYFVVGEGYTNQTAPYSEGGIKTNYGLMDDLFQIQATALGVSSRDYWLGLSMPQFMTAMMQTVTAYQQWFDANSATLASLGIELPG